MEGTLFNMNKVAELLILKGIKTNVEMTGGNCATIYCGEADSEGYFPVAACPGTYMLDGLDYSVATIADFYIGSDKDEEECFPYDGGNDEIKIAEEIAKYYSDVVGK